MPAARPGNFRPITTTHTGQRRRRGRRPRHQIGRPTWRCPPPRAQSTGTSDNLRFNSTLPSPSKSTTTPVFLQGSHRARVLIPARAHAIACPPRFRCRRRSSAPAAVHGDDTVVYTHPRSCRSPRAPESAGIVLDGNGRWDDGHGGGR
jgi:hypothetical protein